MWLVTIIGFFSIVQKPGQAGLTIRARVAADLDRLREQYLPTLSSIWTFFSAMRTRCDPCLESNWTTVATTAQNGRRGMNWWTASSRRQAFRCYACQFAKVTRRLNSSR